MPYARRIKRRAAPSLEQHQPAEPCPQLTEPVLWLSGVNQVTSEARLKQELVLRSCLVDNLDLQVTIKPPSAASLAVEGQHARATAKLEFQSMQQLTLHVGAMPACSAGRLPDGPSHERAGSSSSICTTAASGSSIGSASCN